MTCACQGFTLGPDMTTHVWWIIEFEVAEGQVDRMKEIAAQLTELTMTEAGSVTYEWAMTPEGKLHIHERYVDSEAALAHFANVGPHLPPLGAIIKPLSGDCYGSFSDELAAALASYPLTYHDLFVGSCKAPGG